VHVNEFVLNIWEDEVQMHFCWSELGDEFGGQGEQPLLRFDAQPGAQMHRLPLRIWFGWHVVDWTQAPWVFTV
jgi:hypothetical protein